MDQVKECTSKKYGGRYVTYRSDAHEGNVRAGTWLMQNVHFTITMPNIVERVMNFGDDLEKIVRKTKQLPKIEGVGPMTYSLFVQYFKEVHRIKAELPEGMKKDAITSVRHPPTFGSNRRNSRPLHSY